MSWTCLLLVLVVSPQQTPEPSPLDEHPIAPAIVRELRSLPELMVRRPLVYPLTAIDYVGQQGSPWMIVGIRDALAVETHPWCTALLLHGLGGHERSDLVAFGGKRLAERLVELSRHDSPAISEPAKSFLRGIAHRTPHLLPKTSDDRFSVATSYPAGHDLPTEQELAVIDQPKGSDPDTPKKGSTGVRGKDAKKNATGLEGELIGVEAAARGFDFVWVYDCTGSMTKHLPKAVESTQRISRAFGPLFGDVRWGCIAYRDRVEGRLTLTDSWEKFSVAIDSIEAGKGGSPNERVDLAFDAARSKKMGWRAKKHGAIIFFADAGPVSKIAEKLPRVARNMHERTKITVHSVRFGNAMWPTNIRDFWLKFTEAGGGRSIGLDGDLDLAQNLVECSWPGWNEQRTERILRVIWTCQGWLNVPRRIRDHIARNL